jgi:hypothetical protein
LKHALASEPERQRGTNRHQVALTQRQFAGRIGLDPARRSLQCVLDYGGALEARGESGWLREAQIPDATALPDQAEVVGIHLNDPPDLGDDMLAELGSPKAFAIASMLDSSVFRPYSTSLIVLALGRPAFLATASYVRLRALRARRNFVFAISSAPRFHGSGTSQT